MFKSLKHTFALATFLVASMPVQAQSADPLLGVWQSVDATATVRITPCERGQSLCATKIAERLEPGERSELGKIIVRDIRRNGNKGWVGQFDADGQFMAAKVRQAGANSMSVKICALAFLCDTIKFVRLDQN